MSSFWGSQDDYYRYTFLFYFKHPTIRERFEYAVMKKRINKYALTTLAIALFSAIPITIQWKGLVGQLGISWAICTASALSAFVFFAIRLVMEYYYDTIEQMEYNRKLYYYKLKTTLNAIFISSYSLSVCMNIAIKTDNLCIGDIELFETQFCNVSQVNGQPRIPMDTFVCMLVLSLILYQLFPMPFINTFIIQVVQLISVVIVIIKTFDISILLLNVLCIVLFVGIVSIQFYLQFSLLDRFILEDKMQTLQMNERSLRHFRSKLEDSKYNVVNDVTPDQSVNDTIYYENTNYFNKDNVLNSRPRSLSSSTISSYPDDNSYR